MRAHQRTNESQNGPPCRGGEQQERRAKELEHAHHGWSACSPSAQLTRPPSTRSTFFVTLCTMRKSWLEKNTAMFSSRLNFTSRSLIAFCDSGSQPARGSSKIS